MGLIHSLASIRREFVHDKFSVGLAKDNPFEQFDLWFQDNINSKPLEPTAVTLATCGLDMIPSARLVLLKEYSENGFVFYTNYGSRKARELSENPKAALLFYWDLLERQIRINGVAEKLSYEESDKYFQTRSYESKLGALASKQSKPLESRNFLLKEVASLMLKYPIKVPLPDFWGGYKLVPNEFEFWQGRESRLHDRISYQLLDGQWQKMRLYP